MHYLTSCSICLFLAQWRLISSKSAVSHVCHKHFSYYDNLLLQMLCPQKPLIAWDVLHVMSNVTGITGKLCNKCPKRQVVQNCSSSDSFNAISGFTSNSKAPGGPVTLFCEQYRSIVLM